MKYLGAPQSGSMAGTTASHNRAGQYLRNRRTPVTPTRTDRQTVIRMQFGSAAAAWQTLTAAQQAAWTAFAAAYPITDALGQSITLTGQQYFIGVATSLQNAGQAIDPNPPTNTTVNSVAPVTLYADASGTMIATFAPAAGGDYVLGAQSKLLSAGVTFNKTFTQVLVDAMSNGVFDFSDTFAAQWGALAEGRQVFVKLTPVNSDGMSTPGVIVRTLVGPTSSIAAPTAATSTGGATVYTFTPTPASKMLVEVAPTNIGPWQIDHVVAPATSPQTTGTAGATNWWRARIFDGTSWSPASTPQVGS